MKKTIIALMGLFTLVACSDDTLENAETQTESTGAQNGIKTVTNSGAYYSPWDFNNRINVRYHLTSHVANGHGIYVRVTPYIGLAYYDGSDDGNYDTPTGSYNLGSGAYPNLVANGSEYGNYVQANPIVLANESLTGGAWNTHELFVFSNAQDEHCPLVNVNVGLNYNLYAIRFDILNNHIVQPASILGYTVPSTPGTPAEERLLREYGKVMYYKVEYSTSPTSFAGPAYYTLAYEANMIDPEWTDMNLNDNPFGAPLYYHSGNGSTVAPTYEIVADKANILYPNFKLHNSTFPTPGLNPGFRKIFTSYSPTPPIPTTIFFE